MIIIKLCGGLGNQMFQYALYTKFKTLGENVKLDKHDIENHFNSHQTNIFEVFELDTAGIFCDDAEKLSDRKQDILSKVRRRVIGRKKSHYVERIEGKYDDEIFKLSNKYLDGYWQTEKYFVDIRDAVLKTYQFNNELDDKNRDMLERITNAENSVSIHVRMGDYNTELNKKIYGNICTEQYYEGAMKYFEENYNNPCFFVFSNEPQKIGKIGTHGNVTVVDTNSALDTAWIDMFLMSKCKHNIIANSTFSWWAAWLNVYSQKKVIAPKKWINNQEMIDICPTEWIRL